MARLLSGLPVRDKVLLNTYDIINDLKRTYYLSEPSFYILSADSNVGEGEKIYRRSIVKEAKTLGILTIELNVNSFDEIWDVITQVKYAPTIALKSFRDFVGNKICNEFIPEFDIDGMTNESLSTPYIDKNNTRGFIPCTADACLELMDFYGIDYEGKHIVIIGRSNIIGKPLATELINRNATVTVCHSKTNNLKEICKSADIIISAIGKARFIDKNYVKEGQTIIDVGINRDDDGKICGDVNENVYEIVEAISPVPGGVGSITANILLRNAMKAWIDDMVRITSSYETYNFS